MPSSSSSSSTAVNPKLKRFTFDSEDNVYCNHHMVAVRRVASRGKSREGDEFFGCPLWPNQDCKFLAWKEEVEDNMRNQVLEMKNQALEFKFANLEVENILLKEENTKLKKKIEGSSSPIMMCAIGIALMGCLYVLFIKCSSME